MSNWWDNAPVIDQPAESGSEWWKAAPEVPVDLARRHEEQAQMTQFARGRLEKASKSPLSGAMFGVGGSFIAPNALATAVGLGSSVAAPAARNWYMEGTADRLNRFGNAYEQAASERDQKSAVPPILSRAVRGAAKTLPTSIAAGFLAGPYGAIGATALQERDRAITEARDMGMTEPQVQRYAAVQGVVEALPAAVFQKVGLGGLESSITRQTASKSVVPALKQAIKDSFQELPEENITEIGHSVTRAIMAGDWKAISPKELWNTIKETTFQTLVTMGIAESPNIAQAGAEGAARAERLAQLKALRTVNGADLKREAAKLGIEGTRSDIRGQANLEIKKLEEQEIQNEQQVPPEPVPTEEVRQAEPVEGEIPAGQAEVPQVQPVEAPPEVPIDQDIMAAVLAAEKLGQEAPKAQSIAPSDSPNPVQGIDLQNQPTAKGGKPAEAPVEPVPAKPKIGRKPEAPKSIDLSGMGTAISDNFYSGILDSLKTKGKVPSAERNSSVGKAWDRVKDSMSPDEFIDRLRNEGPDSIKRPIRKPPESLPTVPQPIPSPEPTKQAETLPAKTRGRREQSDAMIGHIGDMVETMTGSGVYTPAEHSSIMSAWKRLRTTAGAMGSSEQGILEQPPKGYTPEALRKDMQTIRDLHDQLQGRYEKPVPSPQNKGLKEKPPEPAAIQEAVPAKKGLKEGVVQTIAGKMDLDEFETKGYAPEQVTKEDWVNLQRANRRKLGQSEESGPKAAPFSDYTSYHEDAVRSAVKRGDEVDPEVLKDYPDLVPPVQPKEPVAKAEVIPEPLPPVEEKKVAEAPKAAKPSGSIKLKQDEYDLSELSDTALRHLSRKNAGTQSYVNSGDNIKTAVTKELANRKLEDTTKGPEGVGEEEMRNWRKAREEHEKAEQAVPAENTTLNHLEQSLFHRAANQLKIPHGRGKFGFSAAKQYAKAIESAEAIVKASPEMAAQKKKIEEAQQKAKDLKEAAKKAEDEYYRVAGAGFPQVPPGVRYPLERGSSITVHEFDPARGKYRIESHGNESWVSPQPLLDNYASKEENDAVLLAEKTFSEAQRAKREKANEAARKQSEEQERVRLKEARSNARKRPDEKHTEVAKTNVKADKVLDSFDLGAHKSYELYGLNRGGLQIVKTMAKEVPEFAYEPVFTVNSKKQLVFRDGITYTLNPEQFNLHPSELTEGQTVGINLEDIGLKQITASEAVAKVLKNNGFSNVREVTGGVTASWNGMKVSLSGKDDKWQVAQPPAHGEKKVIASISKAVKTAEELLGRMHFLEGGKGFQQKASAALAEANDALKSFVKDVGGTSPSSGLNPKHLAGAARVVGLYFKAGYYQFQAFLEKLKESIGQASLDNIMPYLEAEWDKAYASGEFDGMEPRVKPVENPPADSGETTGPKNAKTDELREKVGMEERSPVEPETIEEWLVKATKRIAKDPQYARNLARELAANPRAIDPVEQSALGLHLRALENARQDGEDVLDEIRTVVEATERVGTIWGRSGVSRKVELAADFSIAGMVSQHMRSVNKAPTDEQMEKYSEMADRIAALEGELSESQKKLAQAEVDKQIAEAKAAGKAPEPKNKGGKRAQLKQKASDAVAKFKDKWAALYQLGIAPNPKEDAKKWAEITTAAIDVVKAYGELGIDSFLELMSRVKSDIGKITSDQKDAFREAWDQYRAASQTEAPETPDNASLGALARKLTRWAVESGITKRDEVIDAVHQELTDMGFEVERSDTMAAMSGYGDFRELSKDEVSVKVRGIKGEIQQLLKLEDMQAGQAPAKTGVERRVPTEEERQLIKKVNEAKKRGGYVVTDPAKQLQTALGTAKTAARHRISDLEQAIAKREKIVAGQTKLAPDAELAALQKKRDELNEEYRKIFPPKKSVFSDAARLKAAEKMLDRHISELKADLAAGRLDPAAKKPGLSSPEIEAKKLQLDLLKQAREQAREASPEYQAKEQAKQNARYKKALERQLALWQERLSSGVLPEKRKPTLLDKEMLETKFQIELVKRETRAMIEEAERANRSATGKALGFGGDLLDLSQAIMTGFEMSAVMRQGAFYTLGHPKQALQAIMNSVRSAVSRRADFAIHDELMKRPNHVDYVRGGLETTAADGPLSHREELIRSRIASWLAQQKGAAWALPRWAAEGLLGGERAFRSFANTMRADLFDYMKASVEASRPGTWSEDDAKIVANASNVFSGRGNLPASLSGVASSRILFAPRWVWSRGELLVGRPAWKGDSATRFAVGKVYVRAALGFAGLKLIQHVLYSLLAGDDEEKKPEYELDPRSTDFNKTKIGDTRIDSGAGLNQLVVLAARMATGEKKMSSGKVVPIRGDNVPYGADDTADILSRFLRSKLAPLPSGVLDWIVGENIVGEKTTVTKVVGDRVTPMTWRDIWNAEKELNVPQGTVAAIEAFFGEGVTTYGQRTKFRNADEEGKRKMIFSAFERMDVSQPRRKDFGSDEKFEAAMTKFTADNESAAEEIRWMTNSLGEARTLLREYYLRTDSSGKRGSLREKDTGDLKDSYVKKQRALSRILSE